MNDVKCPLKELKNFLLSLKEEEILREKKKAIYIIVGKQWIKDPFKIVCQPGLIS